MPLPSVYGVHTLRLGHWLCNKEYIVSYSLVLGGRMHAEKFTLGTEIAHRNPRQDAMQVVCAKFVASAA